MNKHQKKTARIKKEDHRKTVKFLREKHRDDMNTIIKLKDENRAISEGYSLSMDLVLSEILRKYGEKSEEAFTIKIPVPDMSRLLSISTGRSEDKTEYIITAKCSGN